MDSQLPPSKPLAGSAWSHAIELFPKIVQNERTEAVKEITDKIFQDLQCHDIPLDLAEMEAYRSVVRGAIADANKSCPPDQLAATITRKFLADADAKSKYAGPLEGFLAVVIQVAVAHSTDWSRCLDNLTAAEWIQRISRFLPDLPAQGEMVQAAILVLEKAKTLPPKKPFKHRPPGTKRVKPKTSDPVDPSPTQS